MTYAVEQIFNPLSAIPTKSSKMVGVLKQFAKFTYKHMTWHPFLVKLNAIVGIFSSNYDIFQRSFYFFIVFYLLFGCPTVNVGHYQGRGLTNPMLITAFRQFDLRVNGEPRNEVRSLSPAEQVVVFESETFRFNRNALK